VNVSSAETAQLNCAKLESMHLQRARCAEIIEKSIKATGERFANARDLFIATQTTDVPVTLRNSVRRTLEMQRMNLRAVHSRPLGKVEKTISILRGRQPPVPEHIFHARYLEEAICNVYDWFPRLRHEITGGAYPVFQRHSVTARSILFDFSGTGNM